VQFAVSLLHVICSNNFDDAERVQFAEILQLEYSLKFCDEKCCTLFVAHFVMMNDNKIWSPSCFCLFFSRNFYGDILRDNLKNI